MPRYFFSIRDGVSRPDLDGTDLPDWQSARLEAIKAAGELLKCDSQRIAVGETWHVDVRDDVGLLLFRLDFNVTSDPATMKRGS